MKRLKKISLIYFTLTIFCLFAFSINSRAEISPIQSSKEYGQEWIQIQNQLESKMISQLLIDYGLNSSQINSLFQQLNQEDIHKLALNINQLVPAGDAVAVVIGLLIVVILIIVILKLLNKEIIIK